MENYDLNDNEKALAITIGNCLSGSHVGKQHAVKAKAIIAGMQRYADPYGIRLTDAHIRRMIQWLRVTGTCEALCSSTSGGYYVAATLEEFRECCDALRDRLHNQYLTEKALRAQLEARINAGQQKLCLTD